jgi:hypothetical protein
MAPHENTVYTRLRDWWRGYSEADVESVRNKIHANRIPGTIIPITAREQKAISSDARTWERP